MARPIARMVVALASIALMLSVVLVTAQGQQPQAPDPERGVLVRRLRPRRQALFR